MTCTEPQLDPGLKAIILVLTFGIVARRRSARCDVLHHSLRVACSIRRLATPEMHSTHPLKVLHHLLYIRLDFFTLPDLASTRYAQRIVKDWAIAMSMPINIRSTPHA